MIMAKTGEAPPGREEALALLQETARAVKVMKQSWLRVAMNLKKIRDHQLWRYSATPCSSYDEYVFGVLEMNRTVARRMLEAMDYTEERRPDVLRDFLRGREDVRVPSWDTLDQLRRARSSFEGREEEFAGLESRVYDDGVGRVTLKREIDESLGRAGAKRGEDGDEDRKPAPAADLDGILRELKGMEPRLRVLDVPKDVRRMLFRLVEALEKERKRRVRAESAGVGPEGKEPRER